MGADRGALPAFAYNTFALPGGLVLDANREYAVRVVDAATRIGLAALDDQLERVTGS